MEERKIEKKQYGHEMDGTNSNAVSTPAGAGLFEIRIKGQLNSQWSEWLEGLQVRWLENGEMILYGPIPDQAALIGVLNKLNRLNLALLSVNEMKSS